VERVSTVGYYAIKQCLIGFITEQGESRCSVCAVTMPMFTNSARRIKASRRFLSAASVNPHQAGEAYVTCPVLVILFFSRNSAQVEPLDGF